MESPWTVEADGKKFGPFTTEQLLNLVKSGKIQPHYMVRKSGGPLVACAEVKGLFEAGTGGSPRPDGTSRSECRAGAPPPSTKGPQPPPLPVAQVLSESVAAAPAAAASAAAAQAIPVVATPGRVRLPASAQLLMTGAAILVGAAAAVVIYINLGPLEKRILRSDDAEQEAVAAASPAVGPPVAATAGQIAAPPTAEPSPSTPADESTKGTATNGPNPFAAPPPAAAGNDLPAAPPPANGPPAADRGTIAAARTSLVQLRLAAGGGRTVVGSGFVVDAEGTIATTLSSCRSVSSRLQAVYHDGSTADVLGFVAVAPGRDLILLKTAKAGTVPLANTEKPAAVGTSVYAAGANPTGDLALTPTTVDQTAQLDTPMQAANGAIYLEAGVHAATLRDRLPSTARGGPVLTEQGELVGLLSVAAGGDQFMIDRLHVTELKETAGDVVRPMGELLVVAGGALAGGPGGFGGPVGPGRRFGGAPVGPGGFPGGLGVGVNRAPPVAAPPAEPVVGGIAIWTSALDSMNSRRLSLLATRSQIQGQLAPVAKEAEQLDREFRTLDRQARSLQSRYAAIEKARAQLLHLRSIGNADSVVDDQINEYGNQLSSLRSQYNDLDYEAGKRRRRYNFIKPDLDRLTGQMNDLLKEANQLRNEYMTHLNPFGAPSKERGAEGVKYYTDQIATEPDTSFAWFGRGCAYLLQGEPKQALVDLDAAIKAAPNDSLYLTVRGVVHARLGDSVQARKDLSTAIRFEENNYWCRFQYCLVLCRSEGFTIIEQQLKECMKIDPRSPNAFTMMAMIKSTGQDGIRHADYALRNAQTAYDLSVTKTWDAAMAMAAAHAEKGDFETAVKYAQESVAAAGERQAAWCNANLKTFQEKKPLRIDWKTFDLWALL